MSHFVVAVFSKTGREGEVDHLLAPYQENNMGDCPSAYLRFVDDEDYDVDDIMGKPGYWENPNAKWDWYEVGGRWSGLLVSHGKTGRRGCAANYAEDEFDSCLTSEIEWDEIKARRLKELEPYEDCFARKFYNPEYFSQLYPTEEAYIKSNTEFSTYAVVTPDGTWHAEGEMGWFGFGSDTPDSKREFENNYWENFIKPAIENGWYLTVVDCHI